MNDVNIVELALILILVAVVVAVIIALILPSLNDIGNQILLELEKATDEYQAKATPECPPPPTPVCP